MIDDHCHPIAQTGGPLALERLGGTVSFAGCQDPPLWRHLLGRRLARLLNCHEQELSQARAEASAAWPQYVGRLLDDAGVVGLVMEVGSESDGSTPAQQRLVVGRPLGWLARIDPFLDETLERTDDLDSVRAAVGDFCRDSIAAGCAGFKSAIAYRTGLAVSADVTAEEAQRSLAPSAAPLRRRAKACRDLVLRDVLVLAAAAGLPVQVHTGLGETGLRLTECHPLLLQDILDTDEGRAATVVLIHGAHPWSEELAVLAMGRPGVLAEVSLSCLFLPNTVEETLLSLLSALPPDRVLVGTDGHDEPETIWFAAHQLRVGWEGARVRLAAQGAGEEWLNRAANLVFEENSRRIYGVCT